MAKASEAHCRESGCSISYSLDIFGDRWSLLVVRDMLLLSKRYFGEFQESEEHIASNILAERLKRLECAGIITKTTDAENQRKNIYQLTEKGLELAPIVVDMWVWGARYFKETKAPKRLTRRMETERDVVIGEIIEHARAGKPFLLAYLR